jgi:hypothetical protein
LLGFLAFTIASLYAFGHSNSPDMRASANSPKRSAARLTPSAAGTAVGARAAARPGLHPCAGS